MVPRHLLHSWAFVTTPAGCQLLGAGASAQQSVFTEASPALNTTAGMITEIRQADVAATQEAVFRVFTGLGGERGWLYMNWAWRARGVLDRLVGGVGLRRGRRDPDHVRAGDALDFWRVESVDNPSSMLLRAEMKLPGRAWLQFDVQPLGDNQSRLVQTAFFAPNGLSGHLYWNLLYPIHTLIFSGLVREIARLASENTSSKPA